MRLITLVASLLGCSLAAKAKQAGGWRSEMLFHERMLAGAGARGVAQSVLHPIDVMRTRMQAKGITSALTARTFVKGISPQFLLAMPAGGLQFAAYEWSKGCLKAKDVTGAFAEVACGAIGALAASVIRVPQEVLKQRVQADIYPNAMVGFSKIVQADGIGGFYKGYFATISRDVPWNALSFMFFAQAKGLFEKKTGRKPGVQENLILGALSGMTAAVIMTPVDVVKTRIMVGGGSAGILGTFTAILQDEGAATLMKGVVPRVMFLAPMAALTLSFYEKFAMMLVSNRLGVPVDTL